MKTAFTAAVALIVGIASVTAKDKDKAPRGYDPISELEAAQSEAGGKKLIVVLVKGMDDACPNCATAMEKGERAIGSGVVKVFAHAETLNKADLSAYPAAFQERAKKKFSNGASVTFLVFDPAMEKLLAEATRSELQSNKKLTAEFKKTVKEAKSESRLLGIYFFSCVPEDVVVEIGEGEKRGCNLKGLEMPETDTITKPVSADAPAKGAKIDITKMTKEEMLAPVANPSTIKDFFVNNLYAAADKAYKDYNGTVGQQTELARLLQSQALYCKVDDGFAFLSTRANEALETNLSNRDSDSLKSNREKLLTQLLPKIHNFPLDQKVAAEFTAITTHCLDNAIRSRASEMGIVNNAGEQKKPNEVGNVADGKEESP